MLAFISWRGLDNGLRALRSLRYALVKNSAGNCEEIRDVYEFVICQIARSTINTERLNIANLSHRHLRISARGNFPNSADIRRRNYMESENYITLFDISGIYYI